LFSSFLPRSEYMYSVCCPVHLSYILLLQLNSTLYVRRGTFDTVSSSAYCPGLHPASRPPRADHVQVRPHQNGGEAAVADGNGYTSDSNLVVFLEPNHSSPNLVGSDPRRWSDFRDFDCPSW